MRRVNLRRAREGWVPDTPVAAAPATVDGPVQDATDAGYERQERSATFEQGGVLLTRSAAKAAVLEWALAPWSGARSARQQEFGNSRPCLGEGTVHWVSVDIAEHGEEYIKLLQLTYSPEPAALYNAWVLACKSDDDCTYRYRGLSHAAAWARHLTTAGGYGLSTGRDTPSALAAEKFWLHSHYEVDLEHLGVLCTYYAAVEGHNGRKLLAQIVCEYSYLPEEEVVTRAFILEPVDRPSLFKYALDRLRIWARGNLRSSVRDLQRKKEIQFVRRPGTFDWYLFGGESPVLLRPCEKSI